jgi:hypothetical protein
VPTSTANRNQTPAAREPGVSLPIDDTRIREIMELTPPAHLLREFPVSERAAKTTFESRQSIHRVLHGADDRLLVIVGPCSIHDYDAAIDYATRLAALKRELDDDLIWSCASISKSPAPTVGWKGLINDPRLDDSFRINEGLRLARRILFEINELELPAGTEYLDMITPQYIADLISWGAIGARTTESQVHRELAPACRVRSVSRMAPTAMSGSASMPSRRRQRPTISCRSPKVAIPRSCTLPATRTAISSFEAARRPTTMPPASRRHAASSLLPDSRHD